ncbi:uncharacterized protein LOC134820738 [Bolinopsis microptera]|uniref:uncharacterized protein LOC134820738 n=1 Tax=Bolinopsis microptera TaxID=2820187 RepID=UPI003079B5CD
MDEQFVKTMAMVAGGLLAGVAITKATSALSDSTEEDVLRNAGFPKQIPSYNDNSPDFTRGYQFVIDITSIMDIGTAGWNVYVDKTLLDDVHKMEQDIAEMKCSEGHVVAVLGLFKRGKTHFLARLCGANFKTDVFQHTRGISIKLPETGGKLNLYVVDSAGKQTPVSIGPGESMESKLRHRRATEAFIEDCIVHMANTILVVVNQLQYMDQVYILALLKKLKHSTVIVVHNFKDAEELDDLQSMIDSDIKGAFDASERSQIVQLRGSAKNLDVKFYKSIRYCDGLLQRPLLHVVLGRDGKPAGNLVNPGTYQLVYNWLTSDFKNMASSINILDSVVQFANNTLPNYLNYRSRKSNLITLQEGSDDTSQGPAYRIVGRELGPVTLHSNLTFAESGALLHHDKLPSKYHATHTIKENADYVFVHIDAPGTINLRVEIINNNTELRVRGERTNTELKYDVQGSHVVRDDRLLGMFEILIPLPGSGNLTPEMDIDYHYGVVEIRIPRAVKESVVFEVGPQNKLFNRSDLMSPIPRTSESDLTATPDRSEGSLHESRASQVTSSNSSHTINHVEYPTSNGSSDHMTTHENGLNRHVQSLSNGDNLTSPPPVHRTTLSSSDPMLTGFKEIQEDNRADSVRSFS